MNEMKQNDGGLAFPTLMKKGELAVAEGGMSLRDWFAGQALIGLCQSEMGPEEYTVSPHLLARAAYAAADAMLAARKGGA